MKGELSFTHNEQMHTDHNVKRPLNPKSAKDIMCPMTYVESIASDQPAHHEGDVKRTLKASLSANKSI